MDAARARKLEEVIAQIVAEMLERRVKDPRLGFVTVTEARVTGDLREATVFYTVYGSDSERTDTAIALASATGLIRSEVGRQTGIKHTPSLTFRQDTVPDEARNIEELVARAKDADAAVAAAREGAVPAGDPDPYRVPAGPADDVAVDDVAVDDVAVDDIAVDDVADDDIAVDDEEDDGDGAAAANGDGRDRAGSAGRGGGSGARYGAVPETPPVGDHGAGYSRA
jgi:ribosome-binding factor A